MCKTQKGDCRVDSCMILKMRHRKPFHKVDKCLKESFKLPFDLKPFFLNDGDSTFVYYNTTNKSERIMFSDLVPPTTEHQPQQEMTLRNSEICMTLALQYMSI